MKRKILEVLKNNKNNFISGENLSNKLGVTRTAVWKYIKVLKADGYKIESISRKGYKLIEEPDILSSEELQIELAGNRLGKEIYYFDSIDSTNNYGKQLALNGAIEGTLIISDEQVGGRGRLGRSWVSPPGTGLWISLVLRPEIKPAEAAQVTTIAAAAVSKAVERTTDIEAGIKWPNDIIINGKKVCGILTEMSAELDYVNYIIVGIGVNVNTEEFPEDIEKIATSIKISKGEAISRKELLINIIKEFEVLYYDFVENGNLQNTIDVCKEKSVTLGKRVRIINKKETIIAEALDISENGELIIRKENGDILNIMSGEVSVRGITDYI